MEESKFCYDMEQDLNFKLDEEEYNRLNVILEDFKDDIRGISARCIIKAETARSKAQREETDYWEKCAKKKEVTREYIKKYGEICADLAISNKASEEIACTCDNFLRRIEELQNLLKRYVQTSKE